MTRALQAAGPVVRGYPEERRGLDFGGFTRVLGMFFANLGCFWRGCHWGDSPKAGSTKWEEIVENWEKTCRLSPEDASSSEYLQ
jgi:hypothetical protein